MTWHYLFLVCAPFGLCSGLSPLPHINLVMVQILPNVNVNLLFASSRVVHRVGKHLSILRQCSEWCALSMSCVFVLLPRRRTACGRTACSREGEARIFWEVRRRGWTFLKHLLQWFNTQRHSGLWTVPKRNEKASYCPNTAPAAILVLWQVSVSDKTERWVGELFSEGHAIARAIAYFICTGWLFQLLAEQLLSRCAGGAVNSWEDCLGQMLVVLSSSWPTFWEI